MLKFFKKLISPFSKIKSALGQKLRALFSRKLDDAMFQELEKLFYEADLGASMSAELVEKLRSHARQNPDPASFLGAVKEELMKVFPATVEEPALSTSPRVILIVGVNGSGKTTTLAKLAHHYRSQGKSVLIAAGDTFRAAAIEQLERWGERIDVEVIRQAAGSDPGAVVFDAVKAATARNLDVLIVDTAGRLHTKTNLMDELSKVRRIIERQLPGAPHETLMVLDAPTGQNGFAQARMFHEAIGLTGVCLTKLDGTAKGGIVVRIVRELKVPVKLIGLGEKIEDLQPFDPQAFVDALVAEK